MLIIEPGPCAHMILRSVDIVVSHIYSHFDCCLHLQLTDCTSDAEFLLLTIYSLTNANDSNASVIVITEPDTPKWFSSYLLFILGIFHLILGIWMIIEYFVLEAKNILVSFPLLKKLL